MRAAKPTAMVHWDHSRRGRLAPEDFMPLAEKSGLVLPLGAWMLRTAAFMVVRDCPSIGLSVTVSPVQFRSTDLIEIVSDVLMETGLEPERLELGIAGDALVEDEARGHAVLGALRALNVRVAVDGFGSDTFSLGHLRPFAFDAIKIDGRFVADLEEQDGGRTVVRSILAHGRSLDVATCAAGVEADGRLLLLSFGPRTKVQGFLLGKPKPGAALAALLAEEAASRSLPAPIRARS